MNDSRHDRFTRLRQWKRGSLFAHHNGYIAPLCSTLLYTEYRAKRKLIGSVTLRYGGADTAITSWNAI